VSTFQRILNTASKALNNKAQPSAGGAGKSDWRQMVRTAADKVTGDTRPSVDETPRGPAVSARTRTETPDLSAADRAAIGRYDYLLKTAEPAQLEQVHRDAFARLSPAQRDEVNAQLRAELPAGDYPASNSPNDLARSATRGEAHNPGFLRKLFAKPSGRGATGALAGAGIGAVAGVGLGAAGGLLAAVAGGAILSDVATPLLEQAAGLGVDFESLAGGLEGGLGEITGGLEGGLGEITGGLEGGLGDVAGGLEGVTGGAIDYATGLGDQLSELGSNFEIPGLSGLGKLFGRE